MPSTYDKLKKRFTSRRDLRSASVKKRVTPGKDIRSASETDLGHQSDPQRPTASKSEAQSAVGPKHVLERWVSTPALATGTNMATQDISPSSDDDPWPLPPSQGKDILHVLEVKDVPLGFAAIIVSMIDGHFVQSKLGAQKLTFTSRIMESQSKKIITYLNVTC